jgi:hypothetical protein
MLTDNLVFDLESRPIRGGENMFLSRVTFAGRRDLLNGIEMKESIAQRLLSKNLGTDEFDLSESLDGKGDLLIVGNTIDTLKKIRDTYYTITVRTKQQL